MEFDSPLFHTPKKIQGRGWLVVWPFDIDIQIYFVQARGRGSKRQDCERAVVVGSMRTYMIVVIGSPRHLMLSPHLPFFLLPFVIPS